MNPFPFKLMIIRDYSVNPGGKASIGVTPNLIRTAFVKSLLSSFAYSMNGVP